MALVRNLWKEILRLIKMFKTHTKAPDRTYVGLFRISLQKVERTIFFSVVELSIYRCRAVSTDHRHSKEFFLYLYIFSNYRKNAHLYQKERPLSRACLSERMS